MIAYDSNPTTWIDTLMAHAYEQKKDPDGFLYITYTEESTLGAMLLLLSLKSNSELI